MRTTLMAIFMLVIGTSLPLGVSAQSSSYGSVKINPSYQEVSPGAQVSFTVFAGSAAGGAVAVAIQPGLTLVGDPSCNGPCPGIDIRRRTDGTFFNVNVYGAGVTIQFTLTVSPTARVGDQFAINATLVGGTRPIEMSSAVVHVTGSTTIPTPGLSLPEQNHFAYLRTSPSAARVAPAGQLLIFIQPLFYGDWDIPDFTVTIAIPSGFEISDGPYCGIRSGVVPQHECRFDKGTSDSGLETLTVYPGKSGPDANGVYLVVRRTDSQLDGKSFHLSSELRIPSAQQNVRLNPSRVDFLTVRKPDLLVRQSDTTVLAGLIEIRSGYEQNAYGCSTPRLDGTTKLQIKPWGATSAVAETTIGYGRLGDSTSGSLEQSCFIPYKFDGDFNAPFVFGSFGQSIYVVSNGDCLRCAIGIITTSTNADVVLVLD